MYVSISLNVSGNEAKATVQRYAHEYIVCVRSRKSWTMSTSQPALRTCIRRLETADIFSFSSLVAESGSI